ncbi:MAG: Spo0B domain-containing protein [Clostridia bacterium]|nr:Spo0B domain-containing protein [Clostridia bacterium]
MKRKVLSKFELNSLAIILVISFVLVVAGTFINYFGTRKVAEKMEQEYLVNVAKSVANVESVKESVRFKEISDSTIADLKNLTRVYRDIDNIVIYDKTGVVVYSTKDKRLIGTVSKYKEELLALNGGESLSKMEEENKLYTRWHFGAVSERNGKRNGFVGVCKDERKTTRHMTDFKSTTAIVALCIIFIVIIIFMIFARLLRKKLKGYSPDEIGDSISLSIGSMNAIRECIFLLDRQGNIIMQNKTASNVSGISQHVKNVSFNKIYNGIDIKEYINQDKYLETRKCLIGGKRLVIEGMPINNEDINYAYFIIGYDATEIYRLNKELEGKESLIETMRVVNHDFVNKMHVIMGYLETKQYDEAKKFIHCIRSVPTEEIIKITKRVSNQRICALLIGKLISAKEIGVSVNVTSGSNTDVLTSGVLEEEYISIIGNLLENSIEELNLIKQDRKTIDVLINTSEKWTLITVTDNGRGMDAETLEKIFEMGYSTKGQNRGVGMSTVLQIAKKHQGNVEVESEKNEGCSITVSMKG